VVNMVRDTGFDRACSNFPGVVSVETTRYQLPRMHVQDWNGDEFARQLSLWCDG